MSHPSLPPTPPILAIPAEITENALVFTAPRDVANFAQTCRSARALVYEAHDQHLWRRLFLQSFDDLRDPHAHSDTTDSVDWRLQLQKRVRLMRVVRNACVSDARDTSELLDALCGLVQIARRAPAMPPPELTNTSKDLAWVVSLLREHPLWVADAADATKLLDHAVLRHADPTSAETNLVHSAAELWCLLGWRSLVLSKNNVNTQLMASRNAARAFVYDMRNYSRENLYGPYRDRRPSVNWKHIQSAITIIQCNLMDLNSNRLWTDTRPPVDLDAIRPFSAPASYSRDPRDWAGVEGHWRRYVCFMDYRDLFTFNYSPRAYDTGFFEEDDFQEATRLIELRLHITRIGNVPVTPPQSEAGALISPPLADSPGPFAPASAPGTPPPALGETAGDFPPLPQLFPIIYFAGVSHGGNGNEAKVKGSVRMTADGNVRWRFAAIHDGYSQWSSEGVQIGGRCSAAGIVGIWTGVHHEDGKYLFSSTSFPSR